MIHGDQGGWVSTNMQHKDREPFKVLIWPTIANYYSPYQANSVLCPLSLESITIHPLQEVPGREIACVEDNIVLIET